MTASPALQWEILKVRSNSAFLIRQNGLSRARVEFSSEPGNLDNKNSFKSSGLVNPKTVDIRPAADDENVKGKGKRVVLTIRRTGRPAARKVEKSRNVSQSLTTLNPRAALSAVRGVVGNYRPDLMQAALARYSQVQKSTKRTGGVKKRPQHRRRR